MVRLKLPALCLLAVQLVSPLVQATQSVLPGFTIMIATHKRDVLLQPLLKHLTTSPPPSLRHIVVIWQNVGTPLPSFLEASSLASYNSTVVKISVRESQENSMNERFRPVLDWGQEIRTDAVMILDDDVVLRRETLEWGYQQFLNVNPVASNPENGRIVGFTGRDYKATEEGGWTYVVQPRESYSMILSNAAWFRKEWLEWYWSDRPEMRAMRSYVDEVFNCDDLLINYVVSNLTRLPPLLLQPITPLRTVPTQGLWTRGLPLFSTAPPIDTEFPDESIVPPSHFSTRSSCLAHFFNAFPPSPLIQTNAAITEDVKDHARWMHEGEDWEAVNWVVEGEETEEEMERREFEQMVDELTEGELDELRREMEEGEGEWEWVGPQGEAVESAWGYEEGFRDEL